MLFTRCPQCTTTFRVTEEALGKAGGRVRCGRCASVFDARAELRATGSGEPSAAASEPPSAATSIDAPNAGPTAAPPLEPQPPAPARDPLERAAGRSAAPPGPTAPPRPPASSGSAGPPVTGPPPRPFGSAHAAAATAIVAQVGGAAAALRAEEEAVAAVAGCAMPELPARRVDEVLASDAQAAESTAAFWSLETFQRRRSNLWRVGAAVAVAALAAQSVHHFRTELVGTAAIGPWLQRAYSLFGATVMPRWDVEQYQILDWVAAAEPSARGQGTLEINARIHNRGPRAQPYPHVQLELKDRWEETVARRTFRPAEYLDGAASNATMRAGATVEARLEVLDPGLDAYGFELDVCVETERDGLTCGNDEIFLH